jgi:hypothetical protein
VKGLNDQVQRQLQQQGKLKHESRLGLFFKVVLAGYVNGVADAVSIDESGVDNRAAGQLGLGYHFLGGFSETARAAWQVAQAFDATAKLDDVTALRRFMEALAGAIPEASAPIDIWEITPRGCAVV